MTIHTLADSLRAAARAYYDTDIELMTDAEYDDGIEQLRIAVAQDPTLAPEFADLLDQVAAGVSAGGDITHSSLMGSMDKATSLDSVTSFVERISGLAVVEPKLDGLAVAAIYRGGKLVSLATRGDGRTGEDILSRAERISGLPTTIATDELEVRGEVFMTDTDFAATNIARTAAGKAAFVNPRNAVSGALRKSTLAHAVHMTFAAYESLDNTTSHVARMDALADLGINVAYRLMGDDVTAAGPAQIIRMIEAFGERRATAGFPTDGVIVKADSAYDRMILGEGSRAPKWAIAYKYEAETGTTTVKNIVTTVGRTGRLAIQVEVEPVFVGGTTITYATGHNVGWMIERDIRVGDTVTIKRAGDVIPYITGVDLSARPADSQPWTAPELDPVGNPWDKSTLLWRSTSPELSVLGRIVYAASRDCLDIEGMGTEVAAALVESGRVTSVADLFELTLDDLTNLTLDGRGFGANGAKVHAEIVKARDVQWNRVITSLGIRMTGRTMGRRLAAAFPTMALLRAASVDELADVDGIGQVKATAIHEGLSSLADAGVLDRLAAAGVNMGQEKVADDSPRPLDGATVVVSGSVPGYSRTTVAEFIEAQGGRASSSVSTSTSLLVSEPSSSSKYVKAEKLGVKIVTPQEFLDGVASGAPWPTW